MTIVEPFGFLKVVPRDEQGRPSQIDSPIKDIELFEKKGNRAEVPDEAKQNTAPETETMHTGIMDEVLVIETKMRPRVEDIVPKISKTLNIDKYTTMQITNYGSMIYIIISALILFARPDFFNVLLSAYQ